MPRLRGTLCFPKLRPMSPGTPFDGRRHESRCLAEVRKGSNARRPEDPGERMLLAHALSVEARKLRIAGMEARGFSDAEIQEALKRRRR